MKAGESGDSFVALGIALLAVVCCVGPLLVAAFGAAVLGGVATIVHGPAAFIIGVFIAAAVLGGIVFFRGRNASCAPNEIVRNNLR